MLSQTTIGWFVCSSMFGDAMNTSSMYIRTMLIMLKRLSAILWKVDSVIKSPNGITSKLEGSDIETKWSLVPNVFCLRIVPVAGEHDQLARHFGTRHIINVLFDLRQRKIICFQFPIQPSKVHMKPWTSIFLGYYDRKDQWWGCLFHNSYSQYKCNVFLTISFCFSGTMHRGHIPECCPWVRRHVRKGHLWALVHTPFDYTEFFHQKLYQNFFGICWQSLDCNIEQLVFGNTCFFHEVSFESNYVVLWRSISLLFSIGFLTALSRNILMTVIFFCSCKLLTQESPVPLLISP